jgi:predicted  nucleic acid-binding Zn-ribbon protein
MRVNEALGEAMEPLSQRCMREFYAVVNLSKTGSMEFLDTLRLVLHELDNATYQRDQNLKRAEQAEALVKRLNIAKAYLEGQRSTIEDSMYDVLQRLELLHIENRQIQSDLSYARETIARHQQTINLQAAELRKIGPELEHLKAKVDPLAKRSGEKSRMLNRVHGEITHYFETMDGRPETERQGDYDAALAGHRRALRRTAEEILEMGRKHTREFSGEILPDNVMDEDTVHAVSDADWIEATVPLGHVVEAALQRTAQIAEAGGVVTVMEAMEKDKAASGGVFNNGALLGTEKDRDEYQRHPAERPEYLQHKAL